MRPIAAFALAAVLAGMLASEPGRGAALPDWLVEASQRATPSGIGRVPGVMLHDEQIVEVPAHGRTVITSRRALRVVTREAADDARASVGYARGSSQVKSFRAWTLGADGKAVREWDLKHSIDVSDLDAGQLYTDLRHRFIEDEGIQPGETFAWEAVTEEEPLFAQWRWWFRGAYPRALSRFVLRLPAGLELSVRAAHLEAARSAQTPGIWSWEMRDQPAMPQESLTPERPDLGPYLCVQALSPDGSHLPAGFAFRDWPAVARWTLDLAGPQGAVTPPVATMAAGLAARAADSLSRIRTIARYVQGLNYVSIDYNIGRGWGYRPHDAGAVLSAGYGDCKDKANLLCALLRAEGHDAWLLPVYSGSRDRVDSAWASPAQFNHCIVAIRMPAGYRGLTIAARPGEQLLPFDPTDPITAFGDLPEDEQGSWGLLVSASGDLVRLPVQPPEQNRFERRIDATLSPEGGLSATVVERSAGQAATDERSFRRRSSRAQYQSTLERWLTTQGGGVAIRSWSASEDTIAGRYVLRVEYDSPSFARTVGGRVLTFRTALVSPRQRWAPGDSSRTQPIALSAACAVETLAVRLPEGFALDERPADVHTRNDLGRLDATWEMRDGSLIMVRRWEVEPRTVGPERWADVRALYGARRGSDEATVVLTRR